MQTKHTPGPWAFRQDSRNIVSTPDNQGRYVTIGQLSESLFITDPEHAANARLIAAAPELLAALDRLLSATVDRTLAEGYEMDGVEYAARGFALAAIAKATGSQS